MKNHTLQRLLSAAMACTLLTGLLTACGDSKEKDSKEEIQEMRDITATELVSELDIGWSLGNTLDSHSESVSGDDPSDYETCWGNPVTTKELIETVKDAGFNTLRVPVTWTGHLGDAPDYKISEAWMNRVQEVIDYGIDSDMYVILNLHHEDWHFPSYDNQEAAKTELVAIWTQIAERFKGYDEHLIFEGLNEPRMVDTSYEWTGGTAEAYEVINVLNAAFVDTIRNAGANNPKRILMIPTYAACTMTNAVNSMEIPNGDDKVIVSLHAYSPYNFALNESRDYYDYMESYATELENLMAGIEQAFLCKGIPVILGEFGARNKNNTADRAEWATAYITAAEAKGIPCIWWDNGAFTSGEGFGLINRTTLTWEYPEIVDALMGALNK